MTKPNAVSPLSQALRRWRRAARLDQAQAARRLNRSLKTLQNWEQARSTPRGQALALVLAQIRHERKSK